MSYIDDYMSGGNRDKKDDQEKKDGFGTGEDWWSMGSAYESQFPSPIKTSFWSGFGMGGSEDYETRFKRKIIEKTTSIFSDLKKKSIHVKIGDYVTRVRSDGYGYAMEVSQRDVDNDTAEVSIKTKVERALAHILAETPQVSMQTIANSMVDKIPEEFKAPAIDCIMASFNALEDRRSKVMYGDIYHGAGQRFVQASRFEGKPFTETPEDPVTAIQMSEKERYDLVKKSKFGKVLPYLKQVERTTPRGSVALTKQFYEKIVEPWLLEQIDNLPPPPPPMSQGQMQQQEDDNQKDEQESQNKDPCQCDDCKKERGEDPLTSEEQKKENEKAKEKTKGKEERQERQDKYANDWNKQNIASPEEQKLQGKMQEIGSTRRKSDHEGIVEDQETQAGCMGMHRDGEKIDFDKEGEEYEKMLEVAEKNMEELQNEKGQDSTGFEEDKKMGTVHVEQNIKCNPSSHIDTKLVRNLSRTFKRIRGKEKTSLTDEGTEIDVEQLIDARVKHYGDYMLEDNPTSGFDIFFGIDGSSSMSGNLRTVRRMVATLIKALEDVPNVNLTCIAWRQGGGLTVNDITRTDEVENMRASGGTPFAKSMWYLKKKVGESTAKRRILFQITDGQIGDWDAEQALEVVTKLRRERVKCIAVAVGDTDNRYLEDAFTPEYVMECPTINQVEKLLTRDITTMVTRHLKGA